VIRHVGSTDPSTNGSSPAAGTPDADGWYLYGITHLSSGGRVPAGTGNADLDVAVAQLDLGPDREPVQVLVRGSLAALVRRVSLADFSAEALQARLGDPALLRLAVQMHNDVICAVHQQRPVLPAKFGAVYAHLDDIATAIDQRSEAILGQLSLIDGCDEWAVHVYVDRRIIRAVIQADQALDSAQQELASAGPGRAYFLQRKLADDLAARTMQVTDETGLAAYQRLARWAVDAVAERPASPSVDADGEAEVLKAAYLVHRERRDDFLADVRANSEPGRAWRCRYSGPWPPYSFAAIPEGSGQ
jgi:hypothetical protein